MTKKNRNTQTHMQNQQAIRSTNHNFFEKSQPKGIRIYERYTKHIRKINEFLQKARAGAKLA